MTIVAKTGAQFEAFVYGAPFDMIGTISFAVVRPADGSDVIAARTTGISEPSEGTYYTTDIAPAEAGSYLIVWTVNDEEASEELAVQTAPIPGPTYATVDDLRNYSQYVVEYSDEVLDQTLRDAERMIDAYIVPANVLDSGLKWDPTTMDTDRAGNINRATCAQAEYILHMGPGFFIEGSTSITGRDYDQTNTPKIAPKAKQELITGDFMSLMGKAR